MGARYVLFPYSFGCKLHFTCISYEMKINQFRMKFFIMNLWSYLRKKCNIAYLSDFCPSFPHFLFLKNLYCWSFYYFSLSVHYSAMFNQLLFCTKRYLTFFTVFGRQISSILCILVVKIHDMIIKQSFACKFNLRIAILSNIYVSIRNMFF